MIKLTNKFSLLKTQLANLPNDKQQEMLNSMMQKIIPIFGTLGIVIEDWQYERCHLSLSNQIGVQNGWGSIQAGGIYTTAEGAMALVIGANILDTQLVLAKSVTIDYLKKAKGNIIAKTELTETQVNLIREQEKGEIALQSDVFDEENTLVSVCKATWVWHALKK